MPSRRSTTGMRAVSTPWRSGCRATAASPRRSSRTRFSPSGTALSWFDPQLASLATWLRAIARNRTLDRLRAAGRRPTLVALGGRGDPDEPDAGLDRLGPDAAVVGGAEAGPDPETAAEAVELREIVTGALASMPDVESTVITLAYREGLTQQEIADRLGWPIGTVKTRTRRALGRLRALLEANDAPVGSGRGGRED